MWSVLQFADTEWTYTSGSHWWGGWVGFLVLLIPTFIANVVTFVLVTFSPRLRRSSSAYLIRYLTLEDALFSLACLVQCSLNLSQRQIVGGFVACEAQALYALFFMLSTGYTLCCIAYNSQQKICFKPGLSASAVFRLHLLIWAFSALIALLSSLILADARVMPSSTYCLVSLVSLKAGLTFYLCGVFTIGGYLCSRYLLIYLHLSRQQRSTVALFAHHKQQAQHRQITVAKRMLVIVCAYFLCALPTVATSIYECIAGKDAPPEVHVWAGHMIHLNSLVNPILYCYMNRATRAALWEMLGFRTEPLEGAAEAGDRGEAVKAEPEGADRGKEAGKVEDKVGMKAAAKGGKVAGRAFLSFSTQPFSVSTSSRAELSTGASRASSPFFDWARSSRVLPSAFLPRSPSPGAPLTLFSPLSLVTFPAIPSSPFLSPTFAHPPPNAIARQQQPPPSTSGVVVDPVVHAVQPPDEAPLPYANTLSVGAEEGTRTSCSEVDEAGPQESAEAQRGELMQTQLSSLAGDEVV